MYVIIRIVKQQKVSKFSFFPVKQIHICIDVYVFEHSCK